MVRGAVLTKTSAATVALTALLLSCIGDSPRYRPAPGLEFDRETVVLRIEADTVEVEGWYTMLCSSTKRPNAAIFYPYPRDSLMGDVRTVLVECRGPNTGWRAVRWYDRPPMGVRWTVPLDLSDTLTVHTVYRQALHGASARYIVTTTRAWDRPLTAARFEIHLPPGHEPVEFSHDFVEQPADGGRFFVYETRDFWPEKDIVVRWGGLTAGESTSSPR